MVNSTNIPIYVIWYVRNLYIIRISYAYKLAFELIIYYSLASLTFKVGELCFICQKLYCVFWDMLWSGILKTDTIL